MINTAHYFHCGRAAGPRSFCEGGSGWELIKVPFTAMLLEHEQRGPILLDAPFGPEGPSNMGKFLGQLSRMLGVSFQRDWAVAERVRQCGFAPTDVQHAVMTHLHVDHTGGMASLPNCTFHLDRREWDFASSVSGGIQGLLAGYALADYADLSDRIVEFDAPAIEEAFDPDNGTLDVDQGVDVFGDGSLRAFRLPGHSRGHAGYVFDVDDQRVFHVGDAAFSRRNITDRVPLGTIGRNFAEDLDAARRTLELLRTLSDAHPDWLILCAHDPELGEACADHPVELSAL